MESTDGVNIGYVFGVSNSGKSFFANELQAHFKRVHNREVQVVMFDDYVSRLEKHALMVSNLRRLGSNYDPSEFAAEIINFIKDNQSDIIAGFRDIDVMQVPEGSLIVEGFYLPIDLLRKNRQYTYFLATPNIETLTARQPKSGDASASERYALVMHDYLDPFFVGQLSNIKQSSPEEIFNHLHRQFGVPHLHSCRL